MNAAPTSTNPYGIRLRRGWKERSLGELASQGEGFIHTGPFGSQLHAHDYKADGTPVVMPQQLVDNTITTDGIARIGESDVDRLSRHVMQEGDIVFSRRGDVTRRAYISSREAGWLCGTGCLLVRIRHPDCDNRFVATFLSIPAAKEYLIQKAVGATMPNLNQGILDALPVVLPPRASQERIIEVLSHYDGLIDNNSRRVRVLEDAARLLFEEWFVKLRFPGREHTRIADGVPTGWRRLFAPAVIDINPSSRLSDSNEHFWVEMADLDQGSMVVQPPIKREGRSGSKFVNGDTLLARITPCLENGKTGYVNFLPEGVVARGSTEFIVLRSKLVTPEFVYCLARTYAFRENAIKSMIGASGRQRVQESCFDKFMVLVPPQPVLDSFTSFARPCFEQIRVLLAQTRKAREARDLLLPRLMSGEVEV